jgi:hypothetical protein
MCINKSIDIVQELIKKQSNNKKKQKGKEKLNSHCHIQDLKSSFGNPIQNVMST